MGLHWLRFSTKKCSDEAISVFGGEAWGDLLPGRFNQPCKRVDAETGVEVHYGSVREGQPVVVEVNGDACDRLGWKAAAGVCSMLEGRITRADLAADIGPEEAARKRLIRMKNQFERDKCLTSFRKHAWHESPEGNTLYIGSRESEVFLRVYDRRGPLRIEFEIKPQKKKHGVTFAHALQRFGPAPLWRGYADRCIWPEPWYQEVVAGECAAAERAPVARTALENAVQEFKRSAGLTLTAFLMLGITVDELLPVLDEKKGLHPEQVQRYLKWSVEAEQFPGLAGEALREWVEKWRSSKPK